MPRKPANLTLSEQDVELWLHRIEEGKRRVEELRGSTRLYREAFHGQFPAPFPEEGEDQQVYVNRVHRVVLQWNGAMYAQNPTIDLRPPWSEAGVVRKEVEKQKAIVNAELDRINLDEPVQKAIQTSLLDGFSWVKSGFHAEWEELIEDVVEVTTNADAENQGFELGPEFAPKEVLLTENHEEHLERHKQYRQKLQNRLRQIEAQMRSFMAAGTDIAPEIQQERIRLHSTIRAVTRHEEMHRKMREKRDREGRFQPNVRVVAENCWADYVHNSNVIWDLHATGPHDWRFVGERIVKTVEQWRKILDKDVEQNWSGPVPGSTGVEEDGTVGGGVRSEMLTHRGSTIGGDSDPDDLAAVWKLWDVEHRRVIWIQEQAEPGEGALEVNRWPHRYMKTAPLRMLWYETREDEFWPISPITHIWSQQLEINRYRTKAAIIARRIKAIGIANHMVPDDFLESIMELPDGSVGKLTGPGVKPQEAFLPIDFGSVPVDIHQMADFAQSDLEMDTGLGEQSLGGRVKAKTATAARVGASAVGVTLDFKLRMVERFIAKIAEDQRALMRQYYTQARFASMKWEGIDKEFQWVGSDLSEFGIEVEFGSSRREEKEVERMQAVELFQMMAQVPGIDLRKLAAWVMTKHGIKSPEEDFFIDQSTQRLQQAQAGPGPGQGQGQREAPTQGGAEQPSADLTKAGPR